jgi:hypothetical protein
MNIIPLVSVKKGNIYDGKEGATLSIDDLFSRVEKDSMLYVLDYDGIEHNNPAFEVYQRLIEQCILWIDNGPRRIDDVMDTIMAGATHITLRKELWPDLDILGVQELTDDEIYVDMSLQHQERKTLHIPHAGDIGIVLFNEETMYGDYLKSIAAKQKIFLYVRSTEKVFFWDEQGITGIIIDVQKKQGV